MYLAKLTLATVVFLGFAQNLLAAPASKKLNKCTSGTTLFKDGLGDWTEESGATSSWKIIDSGLQLVLDAPKEIIQKTNASDFNNPYNEYSAPHSPNFVASQLLQYGKVTYTLKTSGTPGAVTAAILIVPGGGDEIDFEMLGGDRKKVQTNYFYGGEIVYGINGGNTDSVDTADGFHSYTIDWSPERIRWLVDGKVIRTTKKSETCKNKVCKYPTHPTSVQIGLWDSSNPSSTAEWAKGPINWKKDQKVTAIIKSVSIECNSEYNEIV
ncbi:concanavalin A-like lectin/glucanase domain-containing protein [Thamnidium elegans]|nr:concanavalin A-like lectin/glucanase domain-containing protein [Thamnidium elegans]